MTNYQFAEEIAYELQNGQGLDVGGIRDKGRNIYIDILGGNNSWDNEDFLREVVMDAADFLGVRLHFVSFISDILSGRIEEVVLEF